MRKISKYKYVVALTITTCIFVIGILLGVIITDLKYSTINDLQQDLKTQILSLETQYAILSENICSTSNIKSLNQELDRMGKLLTDLEFQVGKNDKNVLQLVEYYSLLEIRHWLFFKELKENCGEKVNSVLFFYSNQGDCADCDKQGYTLSFLKKKYPDLNINVYSFNYNIDNPAVNTLKEIYKIDRVPTTVINGKVIPRYIPIEELEKQLLEN